jgi:S-adenosylmethionine synthetase
VPAFVRITRRSTKKGIRFPTRSIEKSRSIVPSFHRSIGFDAETCGVSASIDEQSPDIAMGVDSSYEVKASGGGDAFELTGAGDQGMMFGYACRETTSLMPQSTRKNGDIKYLRPDGKSQVTVEYDGDRPVRVDTVVISTQHDPDVPLKVIRREVSEGIIDQVIPKGSARQ